ncbi:hypothetical protein T07_8188 [Trichinella nelsoni]|uniref:Uncharacterized protein n=1 Tax=Trichinella nelsoni TaxID=6336 RepID=A0A0V0S409_9BILA|nr:hypothetical protein T07_8188 [Trichinella nelsoni]
MTLNTFSTLELSFKLKSQGITKSISNSQDSKKDAMAQKNPQLCWIQKHAEEICNALFGPLNRVPVEQAWKDFLNRIVTDGHLWNRVNCAFSARTFQDHVASFHVIDVYKQCVKLKRVRHPSFNIIHGKLKIIHCEFFKNALPGIDLEMEM